MYLISIRLTFVRFLFLLVLLIFSVHGYSQEAENLPEAPPKYTSQMKDGFYVYYLMGYPLFAGGDLVTALKHDRPIQEFLDTQQTPALHFGLLVGGAKLVSTFYVNISDYIRHTNRHMANAPAGKFLCANGFYKLADGYKTAKNWGEKQAKNKEGYYRDFDNADDFLNYLFTLKKEGVKLSQLELVGHGNSGLFSFAYQQPGKFLDRAKLKEWNEKYPKQLGELFAPGAKIRISSCMVGLGEKGDLFLRELGKIFLPGGGTIVAQNTASSVPELVFFGRYPRLLDNYYLFPGWRLFKTGAMFFKMPYQSFSQMLKAMLNPYHVLQVEPSKSEVAKDAPGVKAF